MKIDDMLKREDFFKILQTTLNGHYEYLSFSIKKSGSKKDICVLNVYDKLNAIISKNPPDKVKEFLKTEYTVQGSFLRKSIVKLYLKLLLDSKGLFSNNSKLWISGTNALDFKNLLVYPCNKKIRVFDFEKQRVDVITKTGFPSIAIKKEIYFRIKYVNPHIEPIINYGEDWYSERIIDGKPLARMQDHEEEYNSFKKKSLHILESITNPHREITNSVNYKNEVIAEIRRISDVLLKQMPIANTLNDILDLFNRNLSGFNQEINITLSHGDFHHGNIWIENSGKKIILIDWETVDLRSEWYDLFTLFGGLREINGIRNLLTNLHNNSVIDFGGIVGEDHIENAALLVLLEDLKFRIADLESTPVDIGIHEFQNYCKELLILLKTNF